MTTEPLHHAIQLPPRFQLQTVLKDSPGTLVYRVFDASDDRDEAIKMLRHELSEPQQLLRFKAEFSTLAALDHPNIVKVFDYGLVDDPSRTSRWSTPREAISEYFDGQELVRALRRDLADRVGAAPHPSPRHHPSRPEAVEHPGRRAGQREDHGFRRGDREPAGARPADPRDAAVHGRPRC